MSNLPDSWVEVPIGTVSRIVGGGTPPSKDPANFAEPGNGIPWLTPADLSGYRKQTIERGARDLTETGFSACGATLMPKGTVLFSSRAPIGYVAIAANEISTNQGFKSFILPPGIDSRFTYYQLKWLKPEAEAIATGTTFKELSGAATATLPFKIAPADEQTRIANQLDTLLTRIQSCNDRFNAIPALLKRFRRLVVDSAVSGRLSRDWRTGQNSGESGTDLVKRDAIAKAQLIAQRPELAKKKSSTHANVDVEYLFETPDGWSMSTWGSISEWITYGFTKPMPSTENGIRLLTAKDVHPFDVRIGKSGYTSLTAYDGLSEKDRPRTGDLLITKDGTIGRAALVDSDEKFCINQSVAVCWLRSTSMNKAFLELVANASYSQRFVLDKAKGMAIQHLSIVDFAQCPVPVPPLAEQTEIVHRVESLFALADRIEARCTAARAQARRLTPLVLAKAFRGELVPQDPNDEPASALLARIASANTAVTWKNKQKCL